MNETKTILRNNIVYESIVLLLLYSFFCFLKIHYQIFFDSPLQILFVFLSNILLIYPFFVAGFFKSRNNILWYFILITIGEIAIIFYENIYFLFIGMAFYLFSKLSLILAFGNSLKDFKLTTGFDFVKILGPQFLAFAIGYLIYNNTNLGISISLLVIIDAVVQALVFSYIFYFKNYNGVNLIRLGLIFLSLHDVYGGFNIFNQNIDKNFIVSFCLISVGNYILGLGLWKSRIAEF